MKMTHALIPTLRDVPAEAVIVSHQLLLKGGFIRRTAAGMYNYLPLGKRVLAKIEQIVREEMDAFGGQEILMPIVQPSELWMESGRWEAYGDEMFRVNDRHNRAFCLGPTHEEVVTDLVRNEVTSYRQLPLRLYQIQNKYRDERRPRFGLMRSREFVMKDLYSFDLDEAGLDKSYWDMFQAYTNIFTRCGLTFRPVEADGGQIGGGYTHEFMVLAENGEGTIAYCDHCEYAANIEIAPTPHDLTQETCVIETMEKIYTPECKSIEAVAEFLQLPATKCIKTMIYQADHELIAVLVRGDRTINEVKVQRLHPCTDITLADPQVIQERFSCGIGSLGPIGLDNIKIYADYEVAALSSFACGANEDDHHYIHANLGRDGRSVVIGDVRFLEEGEKCPHCTGHIQLAKGIEVGQVFKLGTKYSEAMDAYYIDEHSEKHIIQMGCYGIGVSRIIAAAIEQNHDEKGIIWPKSIAPFQVVIVPIATKNAEQMAIATDLYEVLKKHKIDVLFDDRDERAGVKFNDADLLGIPVRLTIGKKAVEAQQIEVKYRTDQAAFDIAQNELLAHLQAYLNDEA